MSTEAPPAPPPESKTLIWWCTSLKASQRSICFTATKFLCCVYSTKSLHPVLVLHFSTINGSNSTTEACCWLGWVERGICNPAGGTPLVNHRTRGRSSSSPALQLSSSPALQFSSSLVSELLLLLKQSL